MSAAAITSLVIVAVVVVALAYYLIRVVLILNHAVDTLGKVTFGVRAIAFRTEPLAEVLGDVNAELEAVASALEGLVADATRPKAKVS